MPRKKRKEVLAGETIKAVTECGGMYLTLNKQDDELFEVRMEMGKSGNCVKSLLHVIAVLYSVLLQSDVESEDLIKAIKNHLLGVSCGNHFMLKGRKHPSCLDWVARVILKELKYEIKD